MFSVRHKKVKKITTSISLNHSVFERFHVCPLCLEICHEFVIVLCEFMWKLNVINQCFLFSVFFFLFNFWNNFACFWIESEKSSKNAEHSIQCQQLMEVLLIPTANWNKPRQKSSFDFYVWNSTPPRTESEQRPHMQENRVLHTNL